MNMKLEVVVVPVSDVDAAKAFYADKLGFNVDIDVNVTDDYRVVQLTPPGSACSIVLQTRQPEGTPSMAPGSLQGLQLTVADVHAAREELAGRGVEVGEVQVVDAGSLRAPRAGDALDYVGFVFFADPDGNGWGIQQMPGRD
jgi:catechol 2,3-dioxygenase-like lactoylglutathione lyase family enzyme